MEAASYPRVKKSVNVSYQFIYTCTYIISNPLAHGLGIVLVWWLQAFVAPIYGLALARALGDHTDSIGGKIVQGLPFFMGGSCMFLGLIGAFLAFQSLDKEIEETLDAKDLIEDVEACEFTTVSSVVRV